MSIPIQRLVSMGIDLAVNLTPDVQFEGTYVRRRGSVYNPETGATTNDDTRVPVEFILGKYKESEIDGKRILFGDAKVVIRFKDLMLQGVTTVGNDDVIEQLDGPVRQIVDHEIDPTRQVLVLQCRSETPASADSSGASS